MVSIIDISSVINEAKFHQNDFFTGTNDIKIEDLPNIVLENYYDKTSIIEFIVE